MLKIRKIDIVAITDHNEILGALKFKIFLEKYGLKVIIGEEIMTTKGEVIGLFLKKKISSGLSPKETMLEIKKQNGLVYIPHPYDEKRYKTVLCESEIKENVKLIDFIEIHNGRNVSYKYSQKQEEIAEKYNINKVVGSDAHIFFELGRNYNFVKNSFKEEDLKQNIKKIKNYKKAKCQFLSHKVTIFIKIYKKIKQGESSEIFRIIKKKYTRGKRIVGKENSNRL